MGLRPLMTKPAETWAAEDKANRTLAEQEIWEAANNKPCCAKCRRGIKAFGMLPCGYNKRCPNGCHKGGN